MSDAALTRSGMAAIHARGFPKGRAWSDAEIAELIAGPGGFAVARPNGFAIGRSVAGEAELLTLVVDPAARRAGTGRALLAAFESAATAHGADTAFLEVAADNAPALALYRAAGWTESGRRHAYYARATGRIDAITMAKRIG